MVTVRKDFSNPPAGLSSKSCTNKLKAAINELNNHEFSKYYYRDMTIDSLRQLYKYKCAYCETPEGAGTSLRVDHYRPKDKIKNDATDHKGYYWLCYEWSNLLPVCEKCNGSKSNHFPIKDENHRIKFPGLSQGIPNKNSLRSDLPYLRRENSYLLNPELDKVEKHFLFLPNGTLRPRSTKAKISAEIYNLNRDELIFSRKRLADEVINEIKWLLKDYKDFVINDATLHYDLQKLYTKMGNAISVDQPYSRMAFFMFIKFDIFIANRLKFEWERKKITETFLLFREGKLWTRPFKPVPPPGYD